MEKLTNEIGYVLHRLAELGEEPDRIRVYREKIARYLAEVELPSS